MSGNSQINLTYRVDINDLFEASMSLRTRRYRAADRLKLNVVVFGTMVVGGLLAALGGFASSAIVDGLSPFPVALILLSLLAIFYARVVSPWTLRQSAQMIGQARVPGPMQFSSDETGMRWVDKDIDFHLNWSGVEAIYCTSTAMAFMSGATALVLPFSAFPDGKERRAFLLMALERIPVEAAETSRRDRSVVAALTAK